ncbi:hypothetical protein C1H46_023071 [Malus baccata]|uniref:Uncharacterized protein n=1 Tax=Malus baccata TaxID=106549 RepID=A0A540LXU7_MALBA|nr:hypothetical protein C1H46_023071 [Malus baccata]
MEVEQKQAQVIEHFVKQASSLQGSSLVSLIVQLTPHSSLFAFSEIMAVPNVLELQGTGWHNSDLMVELEYTNWCSGSRKKEKGRE